MVNYARWCGRVRPREQYITLFQDAAVLAIVSVCVVPDHVALAEEAMQEYFAFAVGNS
jgi:deoxyribose-phosphate aldolase